ncbi:hypothetical protein AXF42_Ash005012 [Apostasia shenzhenica]|uniref:Uncharacterized protein n=1 Tax=Apostasia shenzhenica TaxID=1088818 RepID=A0A2I0B890_9ASPA|nr:hypothetical protein AXF42_Ash005012 [Apostasia shenzhenica]
MQTKTTYTLKETNQVTNFFAKLNYTDIAFVSFDDVPVEGQNLILTEKIGTDCCSILMFLVVGCFVAADSGCNTDLLYLLCVVVVVFLWLLRSDACISASCFQPSLELVAGFWLQVTVVLLAAVVLSADADAGVVCRLFCCDAGWDASCKLL